VLLRSTPPELPDPEHSNPRLLSRRDKETDRIRLHITFFPNFCVAVSKTHLQCRIDSTVKMAEEDTLNALQGLHRDLLAFCENRLHDIDRLVEELDGRIEEFRELLDKNPKSDQSRQKLSQGKTPYGILFTCRAKINLLVVC
jgi:hypothetical protein